jgi:hypothetical protein
MDLTKAKQYIVTSAFCFSGVNVHIQICNFDTATEAVKHLDEDNARSEKWKAEGSALYATQIQFVKTYDTLQTVGVYTIFESELRERAEVEAKEKGEVS